jgi:hypothetical protein
LAPSREPLAGRSNAAQEGKSSASAPLAAGAALLAAYWRWAAGRAQPALDLSLARWPAAVTLPEVRNASVLG